MITKPDYSQTYLPKFGCIGLVLSDLYTSWASFEKEPTAQIAHLVFANTQANPKKPKELFFCHRTNRKN